MSDPAPPPAQLVEHFFRHETGRLHGALLRLVGTHNFALAEDVAQEAMLRALRVWAMGGIPPNPSAWITQVAMNIARDALRHGRMANGKEAALITHAELTAPPTASPAAALARTADIRDDTLRLLFVCCHPVITADAQVVLALKMLGGFSTGEIARTFLTSEAAIEKQLTRTKERIREAGVAFTLPEGTELAPRLDGVLATLYLIFNEGYKASAGERLLREDFCREAIRLATELTAHPVGAQPRSHALLAFMLLTAARFPTRLDEAGELLRLADQDRSQWDQTLIAQGLRHLAAAANGPELSEYHLQAGIAACHALAPDAAATDWARILRHYDALYRLQPSPIIGLNRAVALAQVHGPQAALDALATLHQRDRLENHYLLHAVLGEFHWQLNQHRAAAGNFRRALHLAQVGPEQVHLTRMLARCDETSVHVPTDQPSL